MEEGALVKPKVLIAIATYTRPFSLARLLSSLTRASSELDRYSLLVVDNDPSGSAEAVAVNSAKCEYLLEPQPGIAAARNAALAWFYNDPSYTHIAFIDDDEEASDLWLDLLLETLENCDADVVSGPVIPAFTKKAPQRLVAGGYFDRSRYPTGAPVRIAATNNTVVRRSLLESRLAPRFAEAYSLTGGSDTEFFTRLRETGAKFVWDDRAAVTEYVEVDRVSLAWALRRQRRVGNVQGRLFLERRGRPALLIGALARIVLGIGLTTSCFLTGRWPRASASGPLMHGIGMLNVLRGSWVVEYERKGAGREERPREFRGDLPISTDATRRISDGPPFYE